MRHKNKEEEKRYRFHTEKEVRRSFVLVLVWGLSGYMIDFWRSGPRLGGALGLGK